VLGYAPRYTALGALREALAWLVDNGQADIGGQPFAEMCDLTVVGAANGKSPNGRRPSRRLTIEGTIQL
jgi:hypothetical protein